MSSEPETVLTIAGSDSGGAAGLQADLKTFTSLGVYGMSVVTAVTAQNSIHVDRVHYISPDVVVAQLNAVLADYGARAIKTGFIGKTSLVTAIADVLRKFNSYNLVIDPVLVNHKKQFMFTAEILQAYRDSLLPCASLITPNWHEAALLAGLSPQKGHKIDFLERAASALHELGARHVLITGIRSGEQIVDCWFDGQELHFLSSPLVETINVHGSGDTLSAAICAFLAMGNSMDKAIAGARDYTAQALQRAANWRLGKGHGPLSHFVI